MQVTAFATAILLLMYATASYSQDRPIPFCGYSIEDGWLGFAAREYVARRATRKDVSGIPQVIESIEDSFDIAVDFDVLILVDEDNAYATVANGRKVVAADVHFLEHLNSIVGTDWAAIQVLAHEVGHHIAGFHADRHRSELHADYWSGQALQRLGSSEESATAAILRIGTAGDTSSHPNKYDRAEYIKRGWRDAQKGVVDYALCDGCE